VSAHYYSDVKTGLLESPTVGAFGEEMHLSDTEVERLAKILESVIVGTPSDLNANEISDFRFFAQKLQDTGFF
jgi:hypothetical protein